MAGIFFDSFSHYQNADLTSKWNDVSFQASSPGAVGISIVTTSGRRGGGALVCNFNSSFTRVFFSTVTDPTAIVGVAHNHFGTFTAGDVVMQLLEGVSAAVQITVTANADGSLTALRGGTGGTVLGTSLQSLQQGIWSFIELKTLIHPTAGTIEVRVNGVPWIGPLTSQNTRATSVSGWDGLLLGSNDAASWCDLYVLDGSTSNNNNFLGDVRIDVIHPTSPVGSSTQWTRSTGTDQWATVDEILSNGDSDFNSTANATDRDSLNFENAPIVGATIWAVQAVAQARKVDSGAAGVKLSVRMGSPATYYDGTELTLGTSYSFKRQIWDRRPTDSAQWLDTDINAAEFGYIKST